MMQVLGDEHGLSIVRLSLEWHEFPEFLAKGIDGDPTTFELEKKGHDLAASDFGFDQVSPFVRDVCKWGNYPGISGKVLKWNTEDQVVSAFQNASRCTSSGKLGEALEHLLKLNGLAVSFASKHLKFLSPDRHVVLDSIISENLGYLRTPEGYCEFNAACVEMRDKLISHGIRYPYTHSRDWRVADVEMAIFQKLRHSRKI